MVPLNLEFHPRAVEEARAARRYYARRSATLANRFLTALDNALGQIFATPSQWPTHLHSTRFLRLRRFPYLVIYRETPIVVQIVAVAHTKRRPGYWRRRTP